MLRNNTYFLDLFSNDAATARRALAGEPVLILPLGEHYRRDWSGNVHTITITPEVVQEFVDNFAQREARGIRRKHLPVNIDHENSRAFGWFDSVVPLEQGVGATFRWTDQGRKALESGEFAYFSAEVYWEMMDRVTGESIHNQLVGGALTNYPFFGESTALYSVGRGRDGVPPVQYLIREGGHMPSNDTNTETPQDERSVNIPEGAFRQFLSWFSSGHQQPSAPVAPDSALQGRIAEVEKQLEKFSTELAATRTERDTYQQRVTELETALQAEQEKLATERFSALAATYSHLPGQTDTLATELRWLYSADPEGKHAAFFTELLRQADEQFAEAFTERGPAFGMSADVHSRIDAAVNKYQEEHPGTAFDDALSAVFRANPELYQLYREGGA